MATPQAKNTIYARLPIYENGLQFIIESIKINKYVQHLEWENKPIFFTRSQARDCWLHTLDLEYKKLLEKFMADNRELHEASMQLYLKGVEQVDSVQWLVKTEQNPALATESDGAGQISNSFRNVAGEAAALDERINDHIRSISNDSGAKEGGLNNRNRKQLNSNLLQMQMTHPVQQEDGRYLHIANDALDKLAAEIYHSGLHDLEAQWLGLVPSEAVERYKKGCMERARNLFKEHAQPEAKLNQRLNLAVAMHVESKAGRNSVGLPSDDDIWDDEYQTIETRDLSNFNINKPFINTKKPLDPITEPMERVALEMHRLRYVREMQKSGGLHRQNSELLKFSRVRAALRLKMREDLNREVSHAEAGRYLETVMNKQANVFRRTIEIYERRSKETSMEPKIMSATMEQSQRIKQENRSWRRRQAKLRKRRKVKENLSASGQMDSFNHAPSSLAQSNTYSLHPRAGGADKDKDSGLDVETGFNRPAHTPASEGPCPPYRHRRRRNGRPTQPTLRKQEDGKGKHNDEGVSMAECMPRMDIDRMDLQE